MFRFIRQPGPRAQLSTRWALFAVFTAFVAFVVSCGVEKGKTVSPETQRPPLINGMTYSPDRVLTRQNVGVAVSARDPDGDPMSYVWRASRGTFPGGTSRAAVTWRSPAGLGIDTLMVTVSDGERAVSDSVLIPVVQIAPPASLGFVSSTVLVDLVWEESIDDGPISGWAGYEVYLAENSLAGLSGVELLPFRQPGIVPGLTKKLDGLRQGTRYYARVGSVREHPGQVFERSEPSDEVNFAPRPQGITQLNEIGGSSAPTAFDLSERTLRRIQPTDPVAVDQVDFYIGTDDPMDGPGRLMLKSVSLLANRHPAWAARPILIKKIGSDFRISTTTDDGWLDQVEIQEETVYALKLPEGNYAKVEVPRDAVIGIQPYRRVRLQWAYQLIPDYPNF